MFGVPAELSPKEIIWIPSVPINERESDCSAFEQLNYFEFDKPGVLFGTCRVECKKSRSLILISIPSDLVNNFPRGLLPNPINNPITICLEKRFPSGLLKSLINNLITSSWENNYLHLPKLIIQIIPI